MARANYGIDAPPVVRNLFLAGVVSIALGWWGRTGGPSVALASFLFWPGVAWLFTSGWMVFGSKVLKLRARDRLLDSLKLKGDEHVLDVGCGRGLLVIGAAKRAPTGRVVGLDLWRTVDQSGNDPEVTKSNAALEGVADKLSLETGDMTKMPFPDASFDVVVSSWAIHNVPTAKGRTAALDEIVRVLKPGGRLAILDIGPGGTYGGQLVKAGLVDVGTRFDNMAFLLPTWRVDGRKPVTG